MVKSPWRLLTGLLSRGRPADRHEAEWPGASSSVSEETRESQATPEPSTALQVGKDEADHQEATSSMAAEMPEAVPADEATASAPDRDVAVVRAKRRNQRRGMAPSKTRRGAKANVSVHIEDVERGNALAEPAAANEPDPVRALDTEIRELRSQLARKLRLQNDQLRQMLRRFEPE